MRNWVQVEQPLLDSAGTYVGIAQSPGCYRTAAVCPPQTEMSPPSGVPGTSQSGSLSPTIISKIFLTNEVRTMKVWEYFLNVFCLTKMPYRALHCSIEEDFHNQHERISFTLRGLLNCSFNGLNGMSEILFNMIKF